MDHRYVEALRSDFHFGNEYLELHAKARQLAYNMCVDISQNNLGINLYDKAIWPLCMLMKELIYTWKLDGY